MTGFVIQTSYGPLPLVGRIHAEPRAPALLVVGGAFPPPEFKHDLIRRVPEASVVVGGLPSMVGPPFLDERPAVFAAAYDEAVSILLAGRAVVTYGISTGCLVTLAMRAPEIRRHVAQEPFFSTAGLWPFVENSIDRLRDFPDNRELASFLSGVFGISRDGVVGRDYRWILERLRRPTAVIMGGLPLEPRRDLPAWPSFTSQEDRRLLAGTPGVTMHVAAPDVGHNIERSAEGRRLVNNVLRDALLAAIADVAPLSKVDAARLG